MSLTHTLLRLSTCGLLLGACDPSRGSDIQTDDDVDAVDAAVALCKPFTKHVLECAAPEDATDDEDEAFPGPADYVEFVGECVSEVGYAQSLGQPCIDAYEDLFACLAEADCEALAPTAVGSSSDDDGESEGGDDVEPEPVEYPCEALELAVEGACYDGEVDDAVEG